MGDRQNNKHKRAPEWESVAYNKKVGYVYIHKNILKETDYQARLRNSDKVPNIITVLTSNSLFIFFLFEFWVL